VYILYTAYVPSCFTKIEQFIKIQLGNLTPGSEDLLKDTFFAPLEKQILHRNWTVT